MKTELKIIEYNQKKYFLVDTIKNTDKEYYYFSNLVDNKDIIIMSLEENDLLKSIEDKEELTNVLALFYDKYRDIQNQEQAY